MRDPPLLYWHLLQTVFVYAPRTFARLFNRFQENIERLWQNVTLDDFLAVKATSEHWHAFSARKQENPQQEFPKNLEIYTWQDARYPPLLREIADPPLVLYVQGVIPKASACAIVGTRHPTPYGRHTAHRFASALARAGITIISGLAYGIDTEAHQATLDAGGRTIAFIGSSTDMIYPQSNVRLAQEITKNGAIITEYPPGTPALPHHFPQRNRLIAGLSKAVLVVEATIDSGSRITARHGLEQNRDVFAIPGDITAEASAGCNELIRTASAQLVTKPEQILEALGVSSIPVLPLSDSKPRDLATQILWALTKAPSSITDLAQKLNASVIKIQQTLSYLEIEGHIRQSTQGYFTPR